MNAIKWLMVFIFVSLSANALAYGTSSSTKSCSKPKFNQFSPPHLTAVAPESEFSFLASDLTDPATIEVSVKKEAVAVNIKKMNSGYLVTGKLPASLENTHARVDINATGTNKCKANDGWLLKIEDKKD